jgi:fatty-acyl-CoA synthase
MPLRFAELAREAYGYPLLIKQLLHTPLATASQQEIVYRDRHRYTYAALRERIGSLATGLASLGVESGTTVAVMEWDSHRYLECFFAIPMMGAVLQTVNIRLSAAQIAYTLRHAHAEVILVHEDFVPLLARIREQLPAVRAIVLIEDGPRDAETPDWIAHRYERLLASSSSSYVFEDFDENAIATTFYTTGTTGEPKGVCFTHRQLVLHTLAVLGASGTPAYGQSFRQGDVYMPMTPMFHVHAWGNPFVATLMGVKQVYPGRYVPEELLALRKREAVSFSHCVPTILQLLLTCADAHGSDLRGWKIVVGGSALPEGLARAALERGIDVYAGYGMSETGPVLSITRLIAPAASADTPQWEVQQRCRAGLPIPLVEVRIQDADGRALPWDDRATGEIVVRTPWLTPCYVGNEQASAELWRGGYLHTQDLARIDSRGSIQITDRLKDVIKTGGEWISSLALENLISRHPAVAEVAVIGAPDKRWGERPHVLVVLRPERTAVTAEDICAIVAAAAATGSIPRYAVPERVTFVESLERTSVGKINKRALRERYR